MPEFGNITELMQFNQQVTQDKSLQLPLTLIYQINGTTTGEASALMNFEYYGKFGKYEAEKESDVYEIGRILNDRVLLATDQVITMREFVDDKIAKAKK